MSIAVTWGTVPDEREGNYPCDRFVPNAQGVYFRGVTVDATRSTIFRWLCQMKVAPYSYDWIDNFGRRSPQEMVDGLNDLAIDQRFMTIFDLVDFEPDEHLTLQLQHKSRSERIFGRLAVTYMIRPAVDAHRLIAKLVVRYPQGLWGWIVRSVLPWGDLIMMRRQLLNFKELAECTDGLESS